MEQSNLVRTNYLPTTILQAYILTKPWPTQNFTPRRDQLRVLPRSQDIRTAVGVS